MEGTPATERKPTISEAASDDLSNDGLRGALKYVFAPITDDEIKYLCLVVCSTLTVATAYFTPGLISRALIASYCLVMCVMFAVSTWLLTVLPYHKRVQFTERVRDVFRYAWNRYTGQTNTTTTTTTVAAAETKRAPEDKITHSF